MDVDPQHPTASARESRWGDLGVRAVSGISLIVVAIVTTRAGGALFVVAWLVAAAAILWEWQSLVGGLGEGGNGLPVWLGIAALAIMAPLARSDIWDATAVLVGACGLLWTIAPRALRGWTLAGMVYAGLLVLSVMALRFSFPFGTRSIIWLFAVVWSTDVFAYFGGRFFSGPKLWVRVSPSKTWSGTLIGVTAGALIGSYAAVRDLPVATAYLPIFVLSLATAAVSQGGDIVESWIKRQFGVKDSSHLIPGHGGVMDRLDGFLAAAVFAFGIGLLRNLPSVALGLFYWA